MLDDFMEKKIKIHNQHNSNYLIIYIEKEIKRISIKEVDLVLLEEVERYIARFIIVRFYYGLHLFVKFKSYIFSIELIMLNLKVQLYILSHVFLGLYIFIYRSYVNL